MTVKTSFSDPSIKKLIQAAFPGAKTRRPIHVEMRESIHVADYWDGGSRTYSMFIDLQTMKSVSSSAIPQGARQKEGNGYNLPIGNVALTPGFAVVQHSIFCGKDVGYRIIIHPDNPLFSMEGGIFHRKTLGETLRELPPQQLTHQIELYKR